ncbi:hypothetical protein K435DRAFT_744526 [Dendrothele bispora CBS 962.96]|uniref:Uncharacterized protein n=1 Tax=Dendrothele bispora (strain CBS 962.96) TaxID=1314807 RepID=A0A4S8MRV5_DENBC|nr:hypothetical protein K435DRAFT_744526 [Dendrothele bispora CBS 962.96]
MQEYQVQIRALKARVNRIPDRLATTIRRVTCMFNKRANDLQTFYLKESGTIPDKARNVFLDLVALDEIPANKVVRVFKRIAGVFDIRVEGDVSRRSIGRIAKEGGNASKLQFIDTLTSAKGVTLSGDGTSHKNETYETKNATVIQEDNKRIQFFLGIKQAVNHTSKTQLDGWIELIEECYHLAYESGLCSEDDARKFWNLVTGFHSDHAEDQKKLFRLLKEWKVRCERELRGEGVVKRMTDLEYVVLIFKCTEEAIRQSGGPIAWDTMSPEARAIRIQAMRTQLVRDIGQADFEKLSDEKKRDVDFLLWAGCCMHKEMNAFKGRCVGMEEFWSKNGLEGPKKMYNRDNAATVQLSESSTPAARRAEDVTKGGAVKVASLCGAVFRHKDRKRGQQDTLRFFFDNELGFSHAEACAVLITYHDLFIQFLTYVKENKAPPRKLNHMEQNVFDGLHCIQTRHEICAITLYWLAVSVPYMREIRGPYRENDNVLKLGELHKRVISFIDKLIDNPNLLIGNDASYENGSFDGQPWERPEAFYAVHRYIPELPHLSGVLVAFLKAARETWLRFTSEYAEDGAISKATPEQIERAWMESTNDLCEGNFAEFRQSSRRNPTLSISQYNSRKMFKINGTSEFIRSLSPEMRRFLRKITREQDASGANRAEKLKLASHRRQVAEENMKKDQAKKDKKKAENDAIDAVEPLLTITDFDHACSLPVRSNGYLTVAALDMQLKWHQKNGVPGTVPKNKSGWGKGRDGKIQLLRTVIDKYIEWKNSTLTESSNDVSEDEIDMEFEVTVDDLNKEGYDSEEEYYQ